MRIVRRINNNVVQAIDNGTLKVVIGSGIGFKAYPNDKVNKNKIEQTFILQKNTDSNSFINLLSSLPIDLLNVSKKIFDLCVNSYGLEMSENVIVPLADHLQFTIERLKKGIAIEHPLEDSVKKYFPVEYKVAYNSLSILDKELGKKIPDTEATSIALHFINAERDSNTGTSSVELTNSITAIEKFIENFFNIKIDRNTTSFIRFSTHLKYYLIRQIQSDTKEEHKIDADLFNIIKTKYPKEFECAKQITKIIKTSKKNKNEILYLTLHISRLIKENN